MSTELTRYEDREDVRELQQRIVKMLPGARQLGEGGQLALAQVALALDLNPFTGEVWAIPSGGSYSLMVGIKGLRRAARTQAKRDGGMYQVTFRVPREDELLGVTLKAGDIAVACDCALYTDMTLRVMKQTGEPVAFTGLGIFRANEKSRMEGVMVARKRAEADALKQAFDLPFGVEGEPEDVVEGDWQEEPERRDPAQDMEDLFGPQARADFEAGAKTASAAEQDPDAYYGFLERVQAEIPYYHHRQHVINTIAQLDAHWSPEHEDVLFALLAEHASKRADEKAAEEAEAEIAEQEAMW